MRAEISRLLNTGRQPLEAMRLLADAEDEAKQLLLPRAAQRESLAFSLTATMAGPELGASNLGQLFGWFNDRMPWRRHFRLLQRLRGAEYQFRDLTQQIMATWERPYRSRPVQMPVILPAY